MLIAACQQGTLNFALGFSCLEMGSARIPKINTNIYSMTSIFVSKIHKDRMTPVIAKKTFGLQTNNLDNRPVTY